MGNVNMKSDVYFIPVEANDLEARTKALLELMGRIREFMVYQEKELVPVKLTIGDSACVYHMHPYLVKKIITEIKVSKARPFLFDTGVIYHGMRQNAVDHLGLVQNKGFCHSKVGAPFIVADGLLGFDGKEFEVNTAHLKKMKVPSFVGMLDSLVVLSHATGHVFSGYAGSLKNVAMGMSCRPTKQVQHSSLKPSVIRDKCTSCGCCIPACPVGAISRDPAGKAFINTAECIGCGECLCACKFEAVYVNWNEDMAIFCQRMCEAAKFILSKFKNKMFITFAFDITQECDCISTKNDKMVSRNLGIFASTDPVSLDQAVSDMVTDELGFFQAHAEYKKMFVYAQSIGLGNQAYNLIKL
ncbi:MAG: DUF362 domain-containing protein [Candidatus Omnitrophota bacterium]